MTENQRSNSMHINSKSSGNGSSSNGSNSGGGLTINESVLLARSLLSKAMGKEFGGKRDYNEVLGYKTKLDYDDYFAKYNRQDIAERIVDAEPKETWRRPPVVADNEDEEKESEFEQAWDKLTKRLRAWNYFKRADILSGIGRYGLLLIGTKDIENVKDFEGEMQNLSGPEDVIYLSPFGEGRVKIEKWDTDPASENFGKPLLYRIDMKGDLDGGSQELSKVKVHYSRVIHIAEDLLEDEVYGKPRLKRVFDRLHDLVKVVGGGAEAFWLNARQGLAVEADTSGNYDDFKLDEEGMTEEVENYQHGLTRYLRLIGARAKTLGAEVADPSNCFDVIISLISAATTIPKRILLGSERGELASSQDEDHWYAHIGERQSNHVEPVILRPFVDRLIKYGGLPQPLKSDYDVAWEPLFTMSEKDEAEVNSKRAETLKKVAPMGEVELLLTREEMRELGAFPRERPDELKTELPEFNEEGEEEQEYWNQLKARAGDPGNGSTS